MSQFVPTDCHDDRAGGARLDATTRDVSPNVSCDVSPDVSPRPGVGDPVRQPGSYFVRITDPKQPSGRATVRVPGKSWDLGIAIVSGKRLTVQVRVPEGKDLAACGVAFVRATYTTSDGLAVQNVQVPAPNGRARFDGIPAPQATVEALDGAENRLAVLFLELDSDDNYAELHWNADVLKLRIVDTANTPLADARVQVHTGTSQRLDERTDARGLVALPGSGSGTLVVHASHPDAGSRTNVAIETDAASADPVDVRLDAQATLRVRFFDHSETLPGLEARILDARTDFEVAAPTSDADGRVCCERIAPGRYRLEVADPDYWPVERSVDAAVGAEVSEVQVRRPGELELTVRSPQGRPLPEVAVDLYSAEFDADVATWVDEGRIAPVQGEDGANDTCRSSAHGLATDSAGRLFLRGLPNGSYRWKATQRSGESSEGFVTIPPRGRANVSATIG